MADAGGRQVVPCLLTRGPTSPALVLTQVMRVFGGRAVLAEVDIELEPGAVGAVTGGNGAGKTTLLRIAAGLLPPTSGTRCVTGPCLYLASGAGARRQQSVEQAVEWVVRVCAGRGPSAPDALAVVGLGNLAHRRVGTLSTGQRVRLTAALALAARPAVVCLDEPTAHLDADGIMRVTEALACLAAAGSAVLMAVQEHDPLPGLRHTRVHLRAGSLTEAALP